MRCSLSKNPSGGEPSHGSARFSDMSTWKALGGVRCKLDRVLGHGLVTRISRVDSGLDFDVKSIKR